MPAGLAWRKFTGQIGEPNINNAALWGPETIVSSESIDGEPSLAGGPNGLFLFWKQGLPDRGYVSKFTGSGWTAPVLITGGQSFASSDLTQDSSGRLHAVWNAYGENELRYTWSDDGSSWASPVDIARGENSYPYCAWPRRAITRASRPGTRTGRTWPPWRSRRSPSRPPDRAATRTRPRRAA